MDISNYKYLVRMAKNDEAIDIHDIMKEVYENLEDKDLYICGSLNYVKKTLNGEGFGVVAVDNKGKIVGSFLCRYPGKADDNYGRDIELEEGELSKVVHMESSVVLPEARGNHLQYMMLRYAERHIAFSNSNQFKYFISTISPKNPASFKSLEKAGYELVKTKEKYGGLERRIYLKKI